jgi:hypothetical protein
VRGLFILVLLVNDVFTDIRGKPHKGKLLLEEKPVEVTFSKESLHVCSMLEKLAMCNKPDKLKYNKLEAISFKPNRVVMDFGSSYEVTYLQDSPVAYYKDIKKLTLSPDGSVRVSVCLDEEINLAKTCFTELEITTPNGGIDYESQQNRYARCVYNLAQSKITILDALNGDIIWSAIGEQNEVDLINKFLNDFVPRFKCNPQKRRLVK